MSGTGWSSNAKQGSLRGWRFLFALPIVLLLTVCAIGSPKSEPPTPQAQTRAEAEIHDLFKDQYAKKTPADRAALAKVLLGKATENSDDSDTRFVLLREARDLAAESADADTALAAIDQMGSDFQIDVLKDKCAVLKKLSASANRPDNAEAVAVACLDTTDDAIAQGDYEAAARLCDLAGARARVSHDPDLNTRVRVRTSEVARIQRQSVTAKAATDRLRTDPSNSEDNLTVGRFLCFARYKWDEGLPLLTKGSDQQLKDLAAVDLLNPTDPKIQKELADRWWALGDQQKEFAAPLRARAVHWYSQAIEGLHGLELDLAKRRIAQEALKDAPTAFHHTGKPQWISRSATYTVSSADPGKDPLPNLLNGTGGGYQYNGFAFHTLSEDAPFIVIDLKTPVEITNMEIINRRDDLQDRARTLTMWVSKGPKGPWKEVWRAPGIQKEWDVDLSPPIIARYVKLGLTEHNIFHLFSVKFFGFGPG